MTGPLNLLMYLCGGLSLVIFVAMTATVIRGRMLWMEGGDVGVRTLLARQGIFTGKIGLGLALATVACAYYLDNRLLGWTILLFGAIVMVTFAHRLLLGFVPKKGTA